MCANWERGKRGGGGGYRGRGNVYSRGSTGDRQPLGGGRGRFSSSSSHPQQRDDGGRPIGRGGFNQSTSGQRSVAGDGDGRSSHQQQGEIQRSQSTRFGGWGGLTWDAKDNKSEQRLSQDERRASDNGAASGADLRRAVQDKIAADQKPQEKPEAGESSSQQPGDICGWGISSEQQAVETEVEVKPEEQKTVASPDRSPSPHPSGGPKSAELKEGSKNPEPKPVTRSPSPRSRPSPSMQHVQPASERVGDVEALYSGWMKHLSGTLDDEFKDCVVQVGENVVLHAHKHMLARFSPVLRAKFFDKSEPLELGDGGMVVVKVLDGFSPRSIRAMIDYIYTGRVDTTELTECGVELFQLASEYAIKDLQQFVESYLSSGISKRNILGMAKMAQDLSMSDLFMDCARFVDDHLVELSASDEYKKIKREGTLIADLLETAAMSKKGRQ